MGGVGLVDPRLPWPATVMYGRPSSSSENWDWPELSDSGAGDIVYTSNTPVSWRYPLPSSNALSASVRDQPAIASAATGVSPTDVPPCPEVDWYFDLLLVAMELSVHFSNLIVK